MRLLRAIQNHPVPVFGALLTGFAAWVVADAGGRRPEPPRAPAPPRAYHLDELPVHALPVCTPAALARLRPGMSRVEVEGLLGPPIPDRVHPVARHGTTYLTAYPAQLPGAEAAFDRPPPPREAEVALEFDASRPGHPLLRIHYPDPLF